MTFFARKSMQQSKQGPKPSEQVTFGSVIGNLWVSDDSERVSFSFQRKNPRGREGDRPYVTLRPKDVRGVIEAVTAFSRLFSTLPIVPDSEQSYLGSLSDELEGVIKKLDSAEPEQHGVNGASQETGLLRSLSQR
jgi:hypothetical protein